MNHDGEGERRRDDGRVDQSVNRNHGGCIQDDHRWWSSQLVEPGEEHCQPEPHQADADEGGRARGTAPRVLEQREERYGQRHREPDDAHGLDAGYSIDAEGDQQKRGEGQEHYAEVEMLPRPWCRGQFGDAHDRQPSQNVPVKGGVEREARPVLQESIVIASRDEPGGCDDAEYERNTAGDLDHRCFCCAGQRTERREPVPDMEREPEAGEDQPGEA